MLEWALFSRNRVFKRLITPNEAHVELLRNGVSFAELTLDDSDEIWAYVLNGDRVHGLYDGQHLIAGPIVKRHGTAPVGESMILVEDDFRDFRGLGWQNPGNLISAQTSEYRRYSGRTETVVKAVCADLSTRLGLGWTIAPDKLLGRPQRVEYRMHPVIDKIKPLLDQDNLVLSLVDGVVDVHAPDVFPRIITPDSGVLGDYTWELTFPTATRVIVGGEGEGTARLFQRFVDTAREAEWGVVEIFKDSRMAQGVSDLSPDGAEALAEGAPTATVTAQLVESSEESWFRFGKYTTRSVLRVEIGPVEAEEPITRVVMDDTPDDGLVVTPHLGAPIGDADAIIAAQIAKLTRSTRDMEKR